ncbi:MAG: WD40 repeat domain-containing protein [Waterburya sp.]
MWLLKWHPIKTWHLSGGSTAIAISSDGQLLATSSGENINRARGALSPVGSSNVELRNLSDGSILRTLEAFYVTSLAFSRNRSLIAAGNNLGQIQVWHTNHGQLLYSRDLPIDLNHTNVNNLTLSSDGQTLISGIGDRIDVWKAVDGQHRYSLLNKGTFSLSPDGQILAIGNSQTPISLYRLGDGTFIRQLEINGNPKFSPDGQLLAITASTSQEERNHEKRIILYRLLDDKLVGELPAKRFGCFAFSPDSRYLATAYSTGGGGSGDIFGYYSSWKPSYSHLVLWQLIPFKDKYYLLPIAKIKSKKDIYPSLAFTPDGSFLVSGGVKKIRFWQVPSNNYTWLWLLGGGALTAFTYSQRAYLLNWFNLF